MATLPITSFAAAPRIMGIAKSVTTASAAGPTNGARCRRLRISPFTEGSKVIATADTANSILKGAYAPWGDKTRHMTLIIPAPTTGGVTDGAFGTANTSLLAYTTTTSVRTITILLSANASFTATLTTRAMAALGAAGVALEAIILVNGVPIPRIGTDNTTSTAINGTWIDSNTALSIVMTDTSAVLCPGTQIDILFPASTAIASLPVATGEGEFDAAADIDVSEHIEVALREFVACDTGNVTLMGFAGR